MPELPQRRAHSRLAQPHPLPDVIIGCSTPILPTLDVVISLTDQSEVSELRLIDPDTDETIFAARIESLPTPKDEDAEDLPIMSAKAVADRVLELGRHHSLTLPTSEEFVAAFEHLLILGDLPRPQQRTMAGQPTAQIRPESEQAAAPSVPVASPLAATPVAEQTPSETFRPGDTAICVFPSKQHGEMDSKAKPCLIVNVRTLGGRRYLDLAQGFGGEHGRVAPYHLVVNSAPELAAACLTQPTRFDLRRRFLIAEDDSHRVHRRLGTLGNTASMRLGEALTFAGDVSPEPVSEERRVHRKPVVVERVSRKIMKSR